MVLNADSMAGDTWFSTADAGGNLDVLDHHRDMCSIRLSLFLLCCLAHP